MTRIPVGSTLVTSMCLCLGRGGEQRGLRWLRKGDPAPCSLCLQAGFILPSFSNSSVVAYLKVILMSSGSSPGPGKATHTSLDYWIWCPPTLQADLAVGPLWLGLPSGPQMVIQPTSEGAHMTACEKSYLILNLSPDTPSPWPPTAVFCLPHPLSCLFIDSCFQLI